MHTFKGSTFQTVNANDTLKILIDSDLRDKDSYDHVLTIGDKEFSYEEALNIKNYLVSNIYSGERF